MMAQDARFCTPVIFDCTFLFSGYSRLDHGRECEIRFWGCGELHGRLKRLEGGFWRDVFQNETRPQ